MSIYPWGETTPLDQRDVQPRRQAAYDGRRPRVHRARHAAGPDVEPHDWAAAVGAAATPSARRTGAGFRGPQEPAVICGPSGEGTPDPPDRCDDTALRAGHGRAPELRDHRAGRREHPFWLGVAGSEEGAGAARAELRRLLDDPAEALEDKLAARERRRAPHPAVAARRPAAGAGRRLEQAEPGRLGAGRRATSSCASSARARRTPRRSASSTARASWAPAGRTTRGCSPPTASTPPSPASPSGSSSRSSSTCARCATRAAIVNGSSGKVVHEVITDGSVYFGALSDPGNTDETAKFPSTVALVWRWTGDRGFLREMYGFAARQHALHRPTSSTPTATAGPRGWATSSARAWGRRSSTTPSTRSAACGTSPTWPTRAATAPPSAGRPAWPATSTERFDGAWWMPEVPGFADSLRDPGNERSFQRHWIRPRRWRSSWCATAARRPAWPRPTTRPRRWTCTPLLQGTSPTTRRLLPHRRPGCDGAPAGPRRAAVLHAEHVDRGGRRGQLRPPRPERPAPLDDGARRPAGARRRAARRDAGDRRPRRASTATSSTGPSTGARWCCRPGARTGPRGPWCTSSSACGRTWAATGWRSCRSCPRRADRGSRHPPGRRRPVDVSASARRRALAHARAPGRRCAPVDRPHAPAPGRRSARCASTATACGGRNG